MAITYQDTLTTDRDRVRFYIGDTVADSGPKPGDGNFTDAEIAGLITLSGSWQRAVYAALIALASAWRRHPTFRTESGFAINNTDIAKGYQDQATEWARKYGFPTTSASGTVGSTAPTRVDGYSTDINSETV